MSTSCRVFRLPAVPATLRASPEPSSAALRVVEQHLFLVAHLAPGDTASPVPAASTLRSAALRPRLRTLFVPYSLRSHENCPAAGLTRRSRALLSLLTPDDGDKKLAEQAGGPVTTQEAPVMATRTKTSAADKAEARRELAASLHTSITAKVAELTSSDTWRAYLDHVASFHSYSAGSVGVFEPVNAFPLIRIGGWRRSSPIGRSS